jgi:hypothetical protein
LTIIFKKRNASSRFHLDKISNCISLQTSKFNRAFHRKMQKTSIVVLFSCFILLLNTSGFSQEIKRDKNILIIFSFTPSTPAYQIITDGIRTKLREAFGDSYNLHMEYLETDRYPMGEYPKERFDIYNRKYREVQLEVWGSIS